MRSNRWNTLVAGCLISLLATVAQAGDRDGAPAHRELHSQIVFGPSCSGGMDQDDQSSEQAGAWNAQTDVSGGYAKQNTNVSVGSIVGAMGTFSSAPLVCAGQDSTNTALAQSTFTVDSDHAFSFNANGKSTHGSHPGMNKVLVKLEKNGVAAYTWDETWWFGPSTVLISKSDFGIITPGTYTISIQVQSISHSPSTFTGEWAKLDLNVDFTIEDGTPSIIDVPAEVPTIQGAIDLSFALDTVRIAAGTYHERLNLGAKRVSIVSADPNSVVVVDGDGLPGSLLLLSGPQSSETVIRGITFRNGITGTGLPNQATQKGGGAIYLNQSSPVIDRCTFEGNRSNVGGAIVAYQAVPTMSECLFVDNQATGKGGAVYTVQENGEAPTLMTDCVLLCNAANDGSAVAHGAATSVAVSLIDSTVCNNSSPAFSGPFVSVEPSTLVCDCAGDLNGNGSVGAEDLSILLGAWGAAHHRADVDCDGVVAAGDLAAFLGAWGTCP